MGEARKNRLAGKTAEMERCEFCQKYTFNKDNISIEIPGGEIKKKTYCTECEKELTKQMERFEELKRKPGILVPKPKKIIYKN